LGSRGSSCHRAFSWSARTIAEGLLSGYRCPLARVLTPAMPELPEVETVRLGLAPVMEGAVIEKVDLRRPDLRIPFPARFAQRLTGRRIESLGRRAKYLLADLDDGNVLIMHLGMSGSFRIEAEDRRVVPGAYYHQKVGRRAHDHVVFHLSSGAGIVFNDPRRFGLMDLQLRRELETSKHFHAMGIEPLGNALDGAVLAKLFTGRAAPLKAALMDQRLIAGLGNIYVCEALWRARLAPDRAAGALATKTGKPKPAATRLANAIREVLTDAIAAGGSSLRDHRRIDGELGDFQHEFAVYDREGEPCLRPACRGTIRRIVQSGRSTFYCPVCQR
jgi:formamidopyrimidine-DNA glycosylase